MSEEEFICISYYDTKKLPIDIHCTKYRNIKYDIQEVLERIDDIDFAISDSRTTKNLLKENKQLKFQLQQKENIIKDIKAQLDYLETYSSKEDVYEDMSRRLNRIEKIIYDSKENK